MAGPNDGVKLTVTASTKLMKFAVGADPEVDKPFEIIENTVELTGEAAKAALEQANVKINSEGEIINATN